jgi:excisionase family DNA binding protein
MTSDLVNVTEAAEILRLRPSTIRAYVLRRRIPYVKLGRRVLFRRNDLESWIATSLVPAHPEYSDKPKQPWRMP